MDKEDHERSISYKIQRTFSKVSSNDSVIDNYRRNNRESEWLSAKKKQRDYGLWR